MKGKMYKTVVRIAMLYGLVTVAQKEADLEATEVKLLIDEDG